MISNFMSIIQPILTVKKIQMSSFQSSRLRDVEKKLNEGNMDIAKAMSILRSEFKYNLTADDYRRIEKELNYNIK